VLACMSYVDLDLNPIRAGLAADLSSSPHTSVQRRLSEPAVTSQAPLHPVAGATRAPQMPVTLNEYLTRTDWTGRARRPDKRGAIAADAPAAIARLGFSPTSGTRRRRVSRRTTGALLVR